MQYFISCDMVTPTAMIIIVCRNSNRVKVRKQLMEVRFQPHRDIATSSAYGDLKRSLPKVYGSEVLTSHKQYSFIKIW